VGSSQASGSLPLTGAAIGGLVIVGLAMLVLGSMSVLAARRRHRA
jgi:LPXTG-motif cell wall-anchored protein